jgi:hypothetical protein
MYTTARRLLTRRLLTRRLLTRRLLAFGLALALVPVLAVTALPATALASGRMVTMKIVGIDRSGQRVSVDAFVISTIGTLYLIGGHQVRLPPGTYDVAAVVSAPDGTGSATLVSRAVKMTANRTVTLNGRHGALLKVSLNVPGAEQNRQGVALCFASTGEFLAGAFADGPGKIYVTPVRSKDLRFAYQSTWIGRPGTRYDLAGSFSGGIPAHPTYRVRASRLAKDQLSLRGGTNATDPVDTIIEPALPGGCEPDDLLTPGVPARITDYRTAGKWTTGVDFGQSAWSRTARYRAGHSYAETFGSAAEGPGDGFPGINGDHFIYSSIDLFYDPVRSGFDCAGKADVTLSTAGRIVKRKKLTECSQAGFSARARTKGWYTLKVSGTRWNPHGPVPAGILSSKVSLAWRFHITPRPENGSQQAFPVTVTRFVPRGLNLSNDAQPGAVTRAGFRIVRGGGQPTPTPRYALRTVRVQASSNGGRSWHPVKIRRDGSQWIAQVQDPASGSVSLRSTVTDVRGDSTIETIYRAYGIG